MSRKYLAFDIEIAREIPDEARDWKRYRPLGITCAASLPADAKSPKLWHGLTSDGAAADQMEPTDAAELVDYLSNMADKGYAILTWNGLGFDFDILAEESDMHSQCKSLALDQVDMMFHVFCQLGYPVGLDSAAKAMGLSGKPPGMSGALAPRMWAEGRREEVLQYVAQDVKTTLELAQVCEDRRCLRWTSRRGGAKRMALPDGWLDVRSAMELPLPDTSWMSKPWPRSRFTGWLG
jgi:hypothetical protein